MRGVVWKCMWSQKGRRRNPRQAERRRTGERHRPYPQAIRHRQALPVKGWQKYGHRWFLLGPGSRNGYEGAAKAGEWEPVTGSRDRQGGSRFSDIPAGGTALVLRNSLRQLISGFFPFSV